MRTVVVGAGPVGMVCAIALARRGDEVVLVDQDAGPPVDAPWQRQGVMQFEHPHFFRHIVREVLDAWTPGVWEDLVAAGGVPAEIDGMPPGLTGLMCRRSVFERVLRATVDREPGLRLETGYAEDVAASGERVSGVVVDGVTVSAERVLAATGRAGRFADHARPPGEEGECGLAYVSRLYRARSGAPWPRWAVNGAMYDGYQSILFPHDAGILSALLIRRSTDTQLRELRHNSCFEAAAASVPVLAPWTDQASFEPVSDVMVGGRLTNTYRRPVDEDGSVPIAGLHFVGDSVSTTNPAAGRGVSLGLAQAAQLLTLLADETDPVDVVRRFDSWCLEQIRPWYLDHVAVDASTRRRFAAEELDVEGPLTSDVIVDAAAEEPSMMPVVGPYQGMLSLPSSLGPLEERTRALLRSGWRPTCAAGPSRDELVDTIRAVAPVA